MRPGEGGTRWVTAGGSAQGSCLLCGVTLPVHAPTLLQGLPRPGNVPVPTGSPWHSINPLLRLHCNAGRHSLEEGQSSTAGCDESVMPSEDVGTRGT